MHHSLPAISTDTQIRCLPFCTFRDPGYSSHSAPSAATCFRRRLGQCDHVTVSLAATRRWLVTWQWRHVPGCKQNKARRLLRT